MFSSKPPFHLTRMSKFPIVPNFPDDFTYPDVDYVPYPMSFIIDNNKKLINVTMGWNEVEGWIITLDINKLITSMRMMDSVILGQLEQEAYDGDWSQTNGPQYDTFEYEHNIGHICEKYSFPGNTNCAVL